jgi:hypothetical protein
VPLSFVHQRCQSHVHRHPHPQGTDLHDGAVTDEFHCSLKAASLNNLTTFEALSHVWGSTENKLSIRLGGQRANVTRNLESALRHSRFIDKPPFLWEDAVCINQADDSRKSLQVRMMRAQGVV